MDGDSARRSRPLRKESSTRKLTAVRLPTPKPYAYTEVQVPSGRGLEVPSLRRCRIDHDRTVVPLIRNVVERHKGTQRQTRRLQVALNTHIDHVRGGVPGGVE